MTNTRKTQIGLMAIAVVLFVLLFLAPTKKSTDVAEKVVVKPAAESSANIESFILIAEKALSVNLKHSYDSLINAANVSKNDTAYLTIANFWDLQKRPDFAAFYVEKSANKQQTSDAYAKAGDRYYYSIRFVKNNEEVPVLYESATRCYQKAIDKNSKNIDAKIQLAACYVEGSQDPMKGITLLREVEKTDSNNVKLQLNFAFFSVKSQQWDKAIKRFNKVLEIDPLYIEAYLHLADAYEQQGDKNKTIEMLEKYAKLTDDAMAKKEILKYIDQLKNK